MSLHDPLNTDERDWNAPAHSDHKVHICRGCKAVLAHGEGNQFNGWFWCAEPCYREVVSLWLAQPAELVTDAEFDQMNRSRR